MKKQESWEEFWAKKEAREREMGNEVERVMAIMDDHGYQFCDHIDFNYAHQFISVETQNGCRIIHWIWAVPNRDNFKAVLKWFCNYTKFYGVTAYMAYDGKRDVARGKYRRIPTFYSAKEVELYYDEYFGW